MEVDFGMSTAGREAPGEAMSADEGRPHGQDEDSHLQAPIAREAIAEQVVKRILDLVRRGILAPGQKLPSERSLAATMGVGRPSLREALRALSLLGVVEIRQGEGIFVSKLTPETLLEPLTFFLTLDEQSLDALFEARVAVEAGIAEIAGRKITYEALARLQECVDRGDGLLEDPAGFTEMDVEFHRLLVEATGNPLLARIAQSFAELGKASRRMTVDLPGVRRQSHKDHREIVRALGEHDPDAARSAMADHLRHVQAAYHLSKARPDVPGADRAGNQRQGGAT